MGAHAVYHLTKEGCAALHESQKWLGECMIRGMPAEVIKYIQSRSRSTGMVKNQGMVDMVDGHFRGTIE